MLLVSSYTLSSKPSNINDIVQKLENKKKEAERFILKYKERNMQDLEEYYKGASWAFDYSLKVIKGDETESSLVV